MSDWTATTAHPAGPLRPVGHNVLTSPLAIAMAAYLILVLVLLPNNWSFYYKDEIAYVAAAERYARGDFANAPNSLWGPLISWLMAVPLSLGASAIATARSVPVLIAVATLWSVHSLARTMKFSRGLQLLWMLTLVPYVAYWSLLAASDDLPLTALLIFYFSIIFDPRYAERRYAGALCGVLGGFCYFAKGFGLGFFLVHFTVCSAVHWLAHRDAGSRRKVLRHFTGGIAIFAALAAIWVAALYQKYGVITFGITGEYNHQIRGPKAKDRPALQIGFVEPPKATSVSIWEDPAYYYDLPQARECCLKPWSPFDSASAFKRQLFLIKLNLGRTLMTFISYSPLTLAVGFAALAYCFAPFWPPNRRKRPARTYSTWRSSFDAVVEDARDALIGKQRLMPVLALFTILLYPIPYLLVFSDERFFWPVLILVMGLGFFLLHLFASKYGIARNGRNWLLGLFAASLLLYPAYRLTTGHKARAAIASIARQIETVPLAGARIASKNDYGASMVMAYYARAKYYGSAAPGMSDEAVLEDLRRKGVQYYFVWDVPSVERRGMTLSRVLKADFRTLSIYRVQ